jgi:hypothetical protein
VREFIAVQEGGVVMDPTLLPVDDSNPALPSVLVSPYKRLLALTRHQLGWLPSALPMEATAFVQSLGSSSAGGDTSLPLLVQDSKNGLWVSQRSRAGLDASLARTFASGDEGAVYVHATNGSLVVLVPTGGVFEAPNGDYTLTVVSITGSGSVLTIRRCIRQPWGIMQQSSPVLVAEFPPTDTTAALVVDLVDGSMNCTARRLLPDPTVVETAPGSPSPLCISVGFALVKKGEAGARIRVVLLSLVSNTIVLNAYTYVAGDTVQGLYCGPPGEVLVGSVTAPTGTRFQMVVAGRVVVDAQVGGDLGFSPFTLRHGLVWTFTGGAVTSRASALVPAALPNGVYTYLVESPTDGVAADAGVVSFVVHRVRPSTTASASVSGSETSSQTETPTATPSVSDSASLSSSSTQTKSPTRSRTQTKTPTRSRTLTKTPTRSRTLTKSPSRSRTQTKSPSRSRTLTKSPSRSHTLTKTPFKSLTQTKTRGP